MASAVSAWLSGPGPELGWEQPPTEFHEDSEDIKETVRFGKLNFDDDDKWLIRFKLKGAVGTIFNWKVIR